MKSELDLFLLPPTQTSIEGSQWVHYKPVSSLTDDSPIEFVIPGQGTEYIDLAHTLLSSDVYFNQKPVSPPNNACPYRAYIESLLNYGPAAKKSHLTSALWHGDTAGKMDDITTQNQGLVDRQLILGEGEKIDLIGHLHSDVFNQDKFLLNGVELRVQLVRSKDAFCLIDHTNRAYLHIEEASLLTRRAKISPGIMLAHKKALSQGTVKIIIGVVENDAFNGHRSKNPFNFRHFNINHFSLYGDSMQIRSKPLQPDFSKGKLYIDAYHTLFSGTGIHFMNEGNNIDRFDYASGYCLFAFDLTPYLSANCQSHWNLVKHGSLRIELRVEEILQQTISYIAYPEYDNILEIDAST
ncbi:uncharacterized protein F54H12.2-like [Belonocnema kinseyi]|uniref:uncharacterized protein F54H12.2-like n=1 Tax=Belonocnema kinseyi TaxID=2817044 RepID=UPI00143D9D34|nr:uncharacterized protein F54H12.2-like [Belonocnema kinseyi]